MSGGVGFTGMMCPGIIAATSYLAVDDGNRW
jgi:hypothetical protein